MESIIIMTQCFLQANIQEQLNSQPLFCTAIFQTLHKYYHLPLLSSNRVWILKTEFPMRRNSAKVSILYSQYKKQSVFCIHFINILIFSRSLPM